MQLASFVFFAARCLRRRQGEERAIRPREDGNVKKERNSNICARAGAAIKAVRDGAGGRPCLRLDTRPPRDGTENDARAERSCMKEERRRPRLHFPSIIASVRPPPTGDGVVVIASRPSRARGANGRSQEAGRDKRYTLLVCAENHLRPLQRRGVSRAEDWAASGKFLGR